MAHATSPRAPRIGGAILFAVFALLVARAPWATAGPAAGDAPADGPSCAQSTPEAMDVAAAEAMERARQRAAGDDSGWVVLNNRGYNYGPPPGVHIDAELFLHEDSDAELLP